MLGLNIDFVSLPFEQLRILYAIIYLSIFSYYDLKHDRDIPDKIVYILSFIALLFLPFYPSQMIIYAIIQAAVIFSFIYFLYKLGQIGLAEAFSLASLSLLFPIAPSIAGLTLPLPFLFFIFVYAGTIFALFTILFVVYKIGLKKKLTIKEFILLILYLVFTYLFFSSGSYNILFFAMISILFFSSLLSSLYKDEIKRAFVFKIPVSEAYDEVFAYEFATESEKKVLGDVKVITKDLIEKMKKAKIKKVTIYKMFPFSPFLLAGLLFALFFSNVLILF